MDLFSFPSYRFQFAAGLGLLLWGYWFEFHSETNNAGWWTEDRVLAEINRLVPGEETQNRHNKYPTRQITAAAFYWLYFLHKKVMSEGLNWQRSVDTSPLISIFSAVNFLWQCVTNDRYCGLNTGSGIMKTLKVANHFILSSMILFL